MFKQYKKPLTILAIVFVLYFVTQQPAGSAGLVKDALGGIGHWADRLAEFFRSLVA